MAAQRSRSKKSKSSKADNTDFLRRLGPGLITGAADDDPSGIATYSQVGSQFGFSILWTMLFSFPLMAAIREISARLGRITGKGITDGMQRHHPKPVVYIIVLLLCLSNIFNLGADLRRRAQQPSSVEMEQQPPTLQFSELCQSSYKFSSHIENTFAT